MLNLSNLKRKQKRQKQKTNKELTHKKVIAKKLGCSTTAELDARLARREKNLKEIGEMVDEL